jgi:hypothetical protein
MKAKKTVWIVIVSLFILVIAAFTTVAVTNGSLQETLSEIKARSFAKLSEEESAGAERVKNLSLSQIVDKIDDAIDNNEQYDGALLAAIDEKVQKTSKKKIEKIILNEEISSEIRTSIMMVCASHDITINDDILIRILNNENEETSMRCFVISELSSRGKDYSEILNSFTESSNDALWGRTLFEMVSTDSSQADKIANAIIEEFNGELTYRYKKALSVKAAIAVKQNTETVFNNLVCLCKDTISKASDKDEAVNVVTDTLFDAPSSASLKYIFGDDSPFTDEYKYPLASQHTDAIKALLAEEATEANAKILCNAIFYAGASEISDDLKEHLERNRDFYDKNNELYNSLTALLEL